MAKYITQLLEIPVFSIGAGVDCDGQLLIVSDLIGEFQAFTPKFVKKYANVAEVMTTAIAEYAAEVRGGAFPADEHTYKMKDGEYERFCELAKQYK